MQKTTTRAGLEVEYGPRTRNVGEIFLDALTHSNKHPYADIRRQYASGNLPNLARHLGALASNAGKEEVAL